MKLLAGREHPREPSPAQQRKLALLGFYERGFSDETIGRNADEERIRSLGGDEALVRYRRGRIVARRERARGAVA